MNVNKLEPDFSTAVMTLSGIGWTRPRIAKAFSAGQSRRKRASIYRCVTQVFLNSGIRARVPFTKDPCTRDVNGFAVLPLELR